MHILTKECSQILNKLWFGLVHDCFKLSFIYLLDLAQVMLSLVTMKTTFRDSELYLRLMRSIEYLKNLPSNLPSMSLARPLCLQTLSLSPRL